MTCPALRRPAARRSGCDREADAEARGNPDAQPHWVVGIRGAPLTVTARQDASRTRRSAGMGWSRAAIEAGSEFSVYAPLSSSAPRTGGCSRPRVAARPPTPRTSGSRRPRGPRTEPKARRSSRRRRAAERAAFRRRSGCPVRQDRTVGVQHQDPTKRETRWHRRRDTVRRLTLGPVSKRRTLARFQARKPDSLRTGAGGTPHRVSRPLLVPRFRV